MLIGETSKKTGLTKKAIVYYVEQGLVTPRILENGYRYFSKKDIELLKRIAVFRKLRLSTKEIKAVLADKTNSTLQKIIVQKELGLQREQAKIALVEKLIKGHSYSEINEELIAIEQGTTVTERLLEAFPGYYGQFICLHFSRFLNEPITTIEQQSAYAEIISFLDNAPSLSFPEDLREFLLEHTNHISTENIQDMLKTTKQSIENPDKFLSENKEMLEQYLAYKQSDEYKRSPVYKITTMLKEFNNTSGYHDVFIPAMKRLSVSYAQYYKQLEIANDKLLSEYPEIANLK